MSHRLKCREQFESSPPGEAAHFAHAVARVLKTVSSQQVGKCGEDLLDLVEREAPVAAVAKVADREKPTLGEVRCVAEQLLRKRLKTSALDKVLRWVGEIFALDDVEQTMLGIFGRWGKFDCWRELVRLVPHGCSNLTPAVIARLAGLPVSLVEQKLMPGSALLATRLVGDDHDGEYRVSSLLRRIVRTHAETRDELLRWLMPVTEQSSLEWADFEHLGVLREVAERVAAAGEPVSILLFGTPGTGKTEFARVLARRLGRNSVFAGLADDDGMEPERSERLAHLMMLRALCRHQRDKIVVVDEADDVLVLRDGKGTSKQWINRLVEDPQAVTIWIVNQRGRLDPAVLRRMTLAIGFERPRLPVRERIVMRAAAAYSVELAPTEARDIASLKTAPAIIASGLRAARLSDGGVETAKAAIHSVMRAMGQSLAPEVAGLDVYDPALSRADADLERLADRLSAAPEKGWSLLLSGPSGTGKTAFARHLALRLGLEIEVKRCSDLISPFVGETEQNIAAAFAQAAERGAILLIDEADSFLYSRAGDRRSWEVSQVNEMLVQMEHLRMPFVATTNLADNLDPASQRRFTMRVTFQAMAPAQSRALFRSHFGQDWPQHLPLHDRHTPGDFAVVAHRAQLLGEQDPSLLVRWLLEEAEARGDSSGRAMGFHVPAASDPLQLKHDRELKAA